MEDEYLGSSALSGDISAFEKLTKMYYDAVRLLAFSIFKQQQEAEDIAHADKVVSNNKFSACVYKICGIYYYRCKN